MFGLKKLDNQKGGNMGEKNEIETKRPSEIPNLLYIRERKSERRGGRRVREKERERCHHTPMYAGWGMSVTR